MTSATPLSVRAKTPLSPAEVARESIDQYFKAQGVSLSTTLLGGNADRERDQAFAQEVNRVVGVIFAEQLAPEGVNLQVEHTRQAFKAVLQFLTPLAADALETAARPRLGRFISAKLATEQSEEREAMFAALHQVPASTHYNLRDHGLMLAAFRDLPRPGELECSLSAEQEGRVLRVFECMSATALIHYNTHVFDAFDVGSAQFRSRLSALVAGAWGAGNSIRDDVSFSFLVQAERRYFPPQEGETPHPRSQHFPRYFDNPGEADSEHARTALDLVRMMPNARNLPLPKLAFRALGAGHTELALAALEKCDVSEFPITKSDWVSDFFSPRRPRFSVQVALEAIDRIATEDGLRPAKGPLASRSLWAELGLRIWAECARDCGQALTSAGATTRLPAAVPFDAARFFRFLRPITSPEVQVKRYGRPDPQVVMPDLGKVHTEVAQAFVILSDAVVRADAATLEGLRRDWPQEPGAQAMIRVLDYAVFAALPDRQAVRAAFREGLRASRADLANSDGKETPLGMRAETAYGMGVFYGLSGRLGLVAFVDVCEGLAEEKGMTPRGRKESISASASSVCAAISKLVFTGQSETAELQVAGALRSLITRAGGGAEFVESLIEGVQEVGPERPLVRDMLRGDLRLPAAEAGKRVEQEQAQALRRQIFLLSVLQGLSPEFFSPASRARLAVWASGDAALGQKVPQLPPQRLGWFRRAREWLGV